jgi:hypothetical protein
MAKNGFPWLSGTTVAAPDGHTHLPAARRIKIDQTVKREVVLYLRATDYTKG